MKSLIELRVHGVSGTPPGERLDIDRVRQVAGDELGRVFERAEREGGHFRSRTTIARQPTTGAG